MNKTWTIHGQNRDNTWSIHGQYMDNTWSINGQKHGQYMVNTRTTKDALTCHRQYIS